MKRVLTNVIIWVSEGTLNTTISRRRGKTAERNNMRKSDFSYFIEEVKNADEHNPIWYAGYLWIDLTEKQIDKVISIIKNGKTCREVTTGNAIFQRDVVKTPSGMKLFSNHDKVFKDLHDVFDGYTEERAKEVLFDFYNAKFLTCGEYNRLYDWISEHTDGNGAVLKNW